MRPMGLTIVALLNWLRAFVFGIAGVLLIIAGHLSGRLVSAIGSGEFVQRLLSGMGKVFGFGALFVAVLWLAAGIGLWTLKSWGRSLTIVLTGLALLLGLLSLLHRPFHIVRVAVDGVILVYLYTPEVQRLFTST